MRDWKIVFSKGSRSAISSSRSDGDIAMDAHLRDDLRGDSCQADVIILTQWSTCVSY